MTDVSSEARGSASSLLPDAITVAGVSVSPAHLADLPLNTVGPRKGAVHGSPVERVQQISNEGLTEVGVWECTPGRFPVTRDGSHSFMYVLSGRASIYGSGGDVHELRPGTVMVEPDRWTGEWEIKETIRKVYVITRTTGSSRATGQAVGVPR
jgi:uncharacterized cupin superfamily protein